jgi:hypothetical protein
MADTIKKIISLTVLPSRLEHIGGTISSLLNQGETPDEVCVWLPKNPIRDNRTIDKIPNFLKHDPIRTEFVEDVGPATKLIPALRKYWNDKETIIVTADDDIEYPREWFGGLIEYSKILKDASLGYRGRKFFGIGPLKLYFYDLAKLYFGHKRDEPKKVDLITASWGCLYKVKFFTEEVFSLDLNTPMFFTDDIWFQGSLAKNGINRFVVPMNGTITPKDYRHIFNLWRINKRDKNNYWSIRRFKKYF